MDGVGRSDRRIMLRRVGWRAGVGVRGGTDGGQGDLLSGVSGH